MTACGRGCVKSPVSSCRWEKYLRKPRFLKRHPILRLVSLLNAREKCKVFPPLRCGQTFDTASTLSGLSWLSPRVSVPKSRTGHSTVRTVRLLIADRTYSAHADLRDCLTECQVPNRHRSPILGVDSAAPSHVSRQHTISASVVRALTYRITHRQVALR